MAMCPAGRKQTTAAKCRVSCTVRASRQRSRSPRPLRESPRAFSFLKNARRGRQNDAGGPLPQSYRFFRLLLWLSTVPYLRAFILFTSPSSHSRRVAQKDRFASPKRVPHKKKRHTKYCARRSLNKNKVVPNEPRVAAATKRTLRRKCSREKKGYFFPYKKRAGSGPPAKAG